VAAESFSVSRKPIGAWSLFGKKGSHAPFHLKTDKPDITFMVRSVPTLDEERKCLNKNISFLLLSKFEL
jgi:hypothetical protein